MLVLLLTGGCMVGPGGRGPRDNRPPNRPEGGGPTRKGCDVELLEPIVVPILDPNAPPGPRRISSGALAVCDVQTIEHVIHVTVEQKLAGGWAPVNNLDGRPYTECLDLPAPNAPVLCEHIINCQDGHYRTVVNVFGRSPLGEFNFVPPEKPEAHIRCPA